MRQGVGVSRRDIDDVSPLLWNIAAFAAELSGFGVGVGAVRIVRKLWRHGILELRDGHVGVDETPTTGQPVGAHDVVGVVRGVVGELLHFAGVNVKGEQRVSLVVLSGGTEHDVLAIRRGQGVDPCVFDQASVPRGEW